MKLLADLQKSSHISQTNVRIIEKFCERWNRKAYDAILETHIMTEHALADALAEIYHVDRVYSFDRNDIDLEALARIPYADALKYRCLSPHADENSTYLVYVLDPTDPDLLAYLSRVFGNYRLIIIDHRLMCRSIDEAYPLELQLPSLDAIKSEKL